MFVETPGFLKRASVTHQNEMEDLSKVQRVVDSCKNHMHANVANKMIGNYVKKYPKYNFPPHSGEVIRMHRKLRTDHGSI